MLNIQFKVFRMFNKCMSLIAPNWISKKAQIMFITPRAFKAKRWELEASSEGMRVDLLSGTSALRWSANENSKGKVLLVHGWEGRATQMSVLASFLKEQGYDVLAVDMPAHGNSKGKRASIVDFANNILELHNSEGPFDAIIGHSMGGAALAIAISKGLVTDTAILISSPSRVEPSLNGFARWIGLNKTATENFFQHMEHITGIHPRAIDLPKLLGSFKGNLSLIHDQDDKEIALSEAMRIEKSLDNAALIATSGLGHRRILQDVAVSEKISEILNKGSTKRAQVA